MLGSDKNLHSPLFTRQTLIFLPLQSNLGSAPAESLELSKLMKTNPFSFSFRLEVLASATQDIFLFSDRVYTLTDVEPGASFHSPFANR